ncbi:cation transporter [Thalassotalea piscium]|uniref:Co/Zn/Cd efflux system component n=1 Tax=Thalassotalea piscium TaxID=1230533 RepID=A0A7X0NE08_9GAMM|nr:cation transporter [Thalassotalea piscium]MBB6541713.1 Co/Zn/Cd efflux system component [Thalassotalea piscium]
MPNCCATEAKNTSQRKLLWIVLILNLTMFIVEFIAGWLANSSGLLADSLDMLADAAVYSLSLYAVGKSLLYKGRAALTNGYLQLSLGLLVLVDVARRIWFGSEPQSELMFSVGFIALIVNITCFVLLFKFRQGDVNLKASWICSRNDMLANIGVLLSAFLVARLNTAWPDWAIGSIIAVIVIHSSVSIIKEATASIKKAQ